VAVVSALYVYPVKSCRGVRVEQWPIAERGFAADRRWMLVDRSGRFVTQRELPSLSLVETSLTRDEMELGAPGLQSLTLPLALSDGAPRTVRVWRDETLGLVHPEGSAWFSSYLGTAHELVYMPDSQRRRVNPERSRPNDIVSFADGYPFLLISEASLADLNARLERPITMERFRPNIVVSGTEPYAEDSYARVRLGEISFRGPKRCERCVVTTIDPQTGEAGKEPLRTLAKYRLADQKVWFGMNLIHDHMGTLRLGDSVEVGARFPPPSRR
jgi:uncharacterized protein YcbX